MSTFDQVVHTSKNLVSASVIMDIGQTLILSGLTEKETSRFQNKVPVLGDIPLVKLLFNESVDAQYNKSVVFMLTPRRPSYLFEQAKDIEPKTLDNGAYIRQLLSQWQPASARGNIPPAADLRAMAEKIRAEDINYKAWEDYPNITSAVNSALQRIYF